MEIEKLKDCLLEWDGVDTVDNGEFIEVYYHGVFDLLREAADALEQLQAELERVRVERDAYKVYFMAVSSKPDCNTCEKMGCEYRPRVGDTVRANCPLYSGPEKED